MHGRYLVDALPFIAAVVDIVTFGKIRAQISAEERKQRTKHLIEIGGAVYSVLGDSFQEGDVEKLIAFLKQQDERGNYFSKAMGRSKQ